MGIRSKRGWLALVALAAFAVTGPTVGAAGADPPVQVPPFQVPATMVLGSSYTVPAPCDLGADQELLYEYDPEFISPTYYSDVLAGPAAPDGTVLLPVPEEATPGTYTLRGWCRDVGALAQEYAEIQPVTVELVAERPPLVASTEVPTTDPRPDPAAPVAGVPGFTG